MFMLRRIRGFFREEAGAIAAFLVMIIPVLLLVGGFATDISQYNAQKRYVQSQADLAAAAAARYLPDAVATRSVARQVAVENAVYGGANSIDTIIRLGAYRDGAFVALPDGSPGVDAVEVIVRSPFRPLLLGAVMTDQDLRVAKRAVGRAALQPMASFTVRNRLLAVNTRNSALLDAVLGPLGLGLTTNVLSYEGLANARVKVEDLLGLATLGLAAEVLTFDDVLKLPIAVPELLGGLVRLGSLPAGAVPAGTGSGKVVTFEEILAMSPQLANMVVGDVLPNIHLSALDILSALAALSATPEQRLGVNLGLNLAPLAAVDLNVGLIRAPVMAVGNPTDTPRPRAEVAQTEVHLSATLANLVGLRLRLEVAAAQAELVALNCAARPGSNDVLAEFDTVTHPVRLALRVSVFENQDRMALDEEFKHRQSTTLLANSVPTRISFTAAEYESASAANRIKPFGNRIQVSGLTGALESLVRGVRQDVEAERPRCTGLLGCVLGSVLGLLLQLVNLLVGTLDALLNDIVMRLIPLDLIVQNLLQALGVDVATADLILNSVSCSPGGGASSALVE